MNGQGFAPIASGLPGWPRRGGKIPGVVVPTVRSRTVATYVDVTNPGIPQNQVPESYRSSS
jgi:hypothetical protein